MKPTPPGWPRLSSAIFYSDAATAIGWLCTAFGFVVRIRIDGDDGTILHSELTFDEAVVMVTSAKKSLPGREHFPGTSSPAAIGGVTTQSLFIYVDDAQAHHDRAKAAGARIIDPPTLHDYGPDYWADRIYAVLDPEGHLWWFGERVRTAPSV